jgi:hypothetical protein
MSTKKNDKPVIFRRFRTLPNGQVLDARKYGLKAWPIRVGDDKQPKH